MPLDSSNTPRTLIIVSAAALLITALVFLRSSGDPPKATGKPAPIAQGENIPKSETRIARLREPTPSASSRKTRSTGVPSNSATTSALTQTAGTARGLDLALRGPTGALASNVGLNGKIAGDESDAFDSLETRQEKWKKRGLTLVPVRIVDVTSKPLEGVRVEVDGIHHGQGGNLVAHSGWEAERFGPPPWDVTNAEGRAYLASPVILSELAEAAAISFSATKAGYAKRRIMRYPVDGSERDEVLRKGNSVIVAAYMDTPTQRVFDFVPEVSYSARVGPKDWSKTSDGRQMTDAVPDGKHVLTVQYKAPDGQKWHSDATEFELHGGESKELEVQLKLGLSLRGKLSDNVRRPVVNGRVQANAQWPPPNAAQHSANSSVMRMAEAEVGADGTFEIQGLPEGPGEIIGVCDGYIAAFRDLTAPVYEQNQRYDLKPGDATPFVLVMEETGNLRVRVLDNTGKPVAGATVSASPNVFWSSGSAMMYLDDKLWITVSDQNGWALLKNLRPGSQDYYISAPGWAPPVHVENGKATRGLNAAIVAGITTGLGITLEPVPLDQPTQ